MKAPPGRLPSPWPAEASINGFYPAPGVDGEVYVSWVNGLGAPSGRVMCRYSSNGGHPGRRRGPGRPARRTRPISRPSASTAASTSPSHRCRSTVRTAPTAAAPTSATPTAPRGISTPTDLLRQQGTDLVGPDPSRRRGEHLRAVLAPGPRLPHRWTGLGRLVRPAQRDQQQQPLRLLHHAVGRWRSSPGDRTGGSPTPRSPGAASRRTSLRTSATTSS